LIQIIKRYKRLIKSRKREVKLSRAYLRKNQHNLNLIRIQF